MNLRMRWWTANKKTSSISGPTDVIPGQQAQWTCTSLDGYPKPDMYMTIGGVRITNGFYSQENQNPTTLTWDVTQNVIMTPTTLNDGQKICCEITTQQPVCLTLRVQGIFKRCFLISMNTRPLCAFFCHWGSYMSNNSQKFRFSNPSIDYVIFIVHKFSRIRFLKLYNFVFDNAFKCKIHS